MGAKEELQRWSVSVHMWGEVVKRDLEKIRGGAERETERRRKKVLIEENTTEVG